jgi:quercetin dioxygenase-like cupin family protein
MTRMLPLLLLLATLAESPVGFTPESIVWKDAPPTMPAGSRIAVLEGDPAADGTFTMRIRIPAGTVLPPHWHPRHERVTVLTGAAEVGFGSSVDRQAVRRYGAGSFYLTPPRLMHYVLFPEETEMQLTGTGPWEMHRTDVSPDPLAPAHATVSVRRVTPPAGTIVSEETEIEVEVDYAIEAFRPDTFHLSLQFATPTDGKTFGGRVAVTSSRPGEIPPPPVIPSLTEPQASATLTQDLGDVWGHDLLARPVRVRVFVHEKTSDTTSRVVGESEWIEYR